MMLRKSCPRCRGDLFLDRSDGPALWSCLQCGRSFAVSAKQPSADGRVPAGAGTHTRAA
jgi:ribosomal protein L37AE/L43A